MTFSKTIAASGTYDIGSDTMRLHDVQVTNNGPGTVYYGDVPGPAVVRTVTAVSGSANVTAQSASEALCVEEGMAASDSGAAVLGASPVVTSIGGDTIALSVASVDNGPVAVTFTPPAISTSNGHPVLPGDTVRFSAGAGAARNQQARRLVADAGGAVLTISKTRA